jgi:hypothetical protein
MKQVDRHLAHLTELALKYRSLGDSDQLRNDLTMPSPTALARRHPSSQDHDFATKERAKPRLPVVTTALPTDRNSRRPSRRKAGWRRRPSSMPSRTSASDPHLIYPGFVRLTPSGLQNLPRHSRPPPDAWTLPRVDRDSATAALAGLWGDYERALTAPQGRHCRSAEEFRWQLEGCGCPCCPGAKDTFLCPPNVKRYG